MILHSGPMAYEYKPILLEAQKAMADAKVAPYLINDAINLAQEDPIAYDLVILWMRGNTVEREAYEWSLGDRIDDYLGCYGTLPSQRWYWGRMTA